MPNKHRDIYRYVVRILSARCRYWSTVDKQRFLYDLFSTTFDCTSDPRNCGLRSWDHADDNVNLFSCLEHHKGKFRSRFEVSLYSPEFFHQMTPQFFALVFCHGLQWFARTSNMQMKIFELMVHHTLYVCLIYLYMKKLHIICMVRTRCHKSKFKPW